uniref:Uncharacterized protein n=1 Tax=Rhizophora mucronata TaxID=61149 RepID=A0A2P2IP80_RHIMU
MFCIISKNEKAENCSKENRAHLHCSRDGENWGMHLTAEGIVKARMAARKLGKEESLACIWSENKESW